MLTIVVSLIGVSDTERERLYRLKIRNGQGGEKWDTSGDMRHPLPDKKAQPSSNASLRVARGKSRDRDSVFRTTRSGADPLLHRSEKEREMGAAAETSRQERGRGPQATTWRPDLVANVREGWGLGVCTTGAANHAEVWIHAIDKHSPFRLSRR